VKKDPLLVAWIRHVIEARCSKRYTPEYCEILPEGDDEGDPWRWDFEERRVNDTMSAAVAALLQEIHHQERRGRPKM